MESIVFIIQDAPYGNEKPWNALRLAKAVVAVKQNVRVFLMGDAVLLAKKGQDPPDGFYNLGQMLSDLMAAGVEVRVCGTCVASRGLKQEELLDGAVIGKMLDLARWVAENPKVMCF